MDALRSDEGEAVEIAPQVRNFQRVAEFFLVPTVALSSVLPLIAVSRPERPWFPILGIVTAAALRAVQVVARARRVLQDGFTHDDVKRAFDVELRRREEEARSLAEAPLDPRRERRARAAIMVLIIFASMFWGVAFGIFRSARYRGSPPPLSCFSSSGEC